MTVAVAQRLVVCVQCGSEFEDKSRTAPRSYCYDCRPPVHLARTPEPVESTVHGEPFTVEHFARWARELTLDNGEPWRVEDFVCLWLEDVFSGAPGQWVFPENWLLVAEGNTKTTTVSGVVLYHAEHVAYANALWAASARDQAQLGYDQAEGFVLRSPRLQSVFKLHPGYRRVAHRRNGSRIQIFAADDRTGDGVIPTLGVLDELHRHRNLKLYRTWRGKLLKRGGQLLTISTAGEPGSEFEETRERIRQDASDVRRDGCWTRAVSRTVCLHEWAVPESGDPEDMALVKAANPFSGISEEMLREKYESPTMTLAHWRRFVCNLPTRDLSSAITEAEWDAARSDEEIPEGEPIWVGIDLGWKWDTTAIIPFWARDERFRLLGRPRIFTPPRDGSSLNPHLLEDALREVHARNPIHSVAMDMERGEQLAAWIEEELGAEVIDRIQSNQFAAIDFNMFTEALRNGWLFHDGDAELRQHVLNAVTRTLQNGGARFDRPSDNRIAVELQGRRVIDGLTAAAMVHSTAMREEPALNVDLVEVL